MQFEVFGGVDARFFKDHAHITSQRDKGDKERRDVKKEENF